MVILTMQDYRLTVTLARLVTEFLERPGLAQSTRQSYEVALMLLLAECGRLPVEIISRQFISEGASQ
ncbi:hypothetical protein QUA82_23710 [Microcoleus sp. F8-D3]